MHRIKTHLEKQNTLVSRPANLLQCHFATKIYFLAKERKLNIPAHLHVNKTILKGVDWLAITGNTFPSISCMTAPASAHSPLNRLPLCSSSDTPYISVMSSST